MFADNKSQSLKAVNGDELRLEVVGDNIAISFPADDGATVTTHSLNLMLLSPRAKARQKALKMTFDELGPTGPKPGEWRQKLQSGALDDAGMDLFWREIDASLVPNMARIARDLNTGTLDKTHLIPRSLDYWRALCGAPADDIDQERWLKDVFEPHRRRLIKLNLPHGLDLLPYYGTSA